MEQQNSFLIGDLVPETILRVENRTTDAARAAIWIRDGLLEISGNPDYRDDFDQLEIWGPTTNLTIGQQEYPFEMLVPPLDLNEHSSGYNMSTLDILLWLDFPFNKIRRKLDPTHYQDSDKFQQVNSIPTQWYRFADLVGFNPIPNRPYQVVARILQMHPIIDDDLDSTPILLPREWNEVLIWAAAARGFAELQEFEKYSEIRQMLQGDPKHPGKQGLFEAVKKRRKREAWRSEQALRPVLRAYGWGNY